MILGNRGQSAQAGFRHESSLSSISAVPRGPKGNGQTRRVSSVTRRAPGRFLPQSKFGRTSAPFLPQARQVNRGLCQTIEHHRPSYRH
jgi:hypothetical protein